MTLSSGGNLSLSGEISSSIDGRGTVGVYRLRVNNYSEANNYWTIFTGSKVESNGDNGQGNLEFHTSGQFRGYIEDDRVGTAQMNFTGQHRTTAADKTLHSNNYIGYIVSSDGKYKNINSKYGKNNIKQNININDALPYVSLSTISFDKSVFGVVTDRMEEEENRRYSSGVFVSVYNKDEGDERLVVNGCGEGSIWVSNYNGNLENGDYIVSSPIPGIGMKQDDDILHNYTVAKITMDCNFNPQLVPVEVIKQEEIIDASGNITYKNMLDENGNPIYEYKLDASGNILYDYEYEMKTITHDHGEYKVAFVGCTYKCS
jgi:hypothetical protein